MEPRKMLFNYALKLLGGRRYTSAGLQKKLNEKLKKMKIVAAGDTESDTIGPAEDVSRVIKRLTELRLLNDNEYATLYIADQIRSKPQGIRMLQMRMTAKGLPKDIIGRALSAAGLDEQSLARAAAVKKLKTLSRLPAQKQKEKVARFLASRGFGSGAITRAINGSYKENTESFPSYED